MHIQIHKGGDNMPKVLAFISALSPQCAWVIELKKFQRRRSTNQNALLWKIYCKILESCGEDLRGWTKDDLHEFMLGTHFGWERLAGFGMTRLHPIKRSSKLSTAEFSELLQFVYRFAAEHGIYIESPNERAA